MNILLNYDLSLTLAIHQLASSVPWLSCISVFLADYAQYLVLGALLLIALVWPAWRRIAMLAVISGFLARYGVKSVILLFVERNRPYVVNEQVVPLITQVSEDVWKSFPSGHTIFFFALATAIYLHDSKYGKYFLVSAGLIGISRVMVGVHFVSDVLAGAVLGVLVGYLVVWLYRKFSL